MYRLRLRWSDDVEDGTTVDTMGACLRYLGNELARIGAEMDYPQDVRIIRVTIEEEK